MTERVTAMYILFESRQTNISNATIYDIDIMGSVPTEKEAMDWRNKNFDYRGYKYMRKD